MEYPFKDLLPLDEVLEREGYYKDWTHLDPKVFYSLTQISEYIKTKGYGVDVRLLIAQLAEHFSLKTSQINQIELFFKDVMQELAEDKDFHSLPEIAGARGGFDTLGERLNNTVSQTEFDSWVETLLDGGPSIFMDSLAELQSTYPNGASGVALVRETDPAKIYVWVGSSWKDYGDYQGVELRNGIVTLDKIEDSIISFLSNSEEIADKNIKGRVLLNRGAHRVNREGCYTEGKNLFSGYEIGYVQNGSGLMDWPDDARRRTKPIALPENETTTLTISGDINRNSWAFLDVDMKDMGLGISGATVTAPKDAYWAQCFYYNASSDVPTGNEVQVEMGSVVTAYEPYEQSLVDADRYFIVDKETYFVSPLRTTLNSLVRKSEGEVKDVYGVRYKVNQSNPELERIGASVGLVSGVTIGSTLVRNDFDNIYPWSDMKVCNLKMTDWGATKVTYKEDNDFAYDGSNGDVMVEIPKHYVRRYRENGYEYIMISGTPQDGFVLDPSFVENGKELDRIYVGRYNNYIENDIPQSITGAYPTAYNSLSTLLTMSENKGKGYSVLDFRTLSTLQRLFLVEFATRDSQSVMGGITKTVYHGKPDCLAIYSGTQVNKITIQQGDQSDKFRVGQRCSVAITPEFQDRHITEVNDLSGGRREIVFDGTPVDLIAGQTQICNIAQESGNTDHIASSSGRKAGDSDKVAFTYRGVENLYGNIHEIIAGAFTKNGVVHLLENMSDYGTQDIESVSKKLSWQMPDIPYTGAYDATTPYIQEMGYDPLNPLVILPSVGGTNTIGADYWCDEVNAPIQSYLQYCAFGGGWDHYERSGLFNYRFFVNNEVDNPGWLHGSRLIYKNI